MVIAFLWTVILLELNGEIMAGVKGKSGGKRKGAGRKPSKIKNKTKFEKIDDELVGNMQACNDKELSFPIELDEVPGARKIWSDVLLLDQQSKYHLLDARHKEILKSYCLAVAMRDILVRNFTRNQIVTYKKQGEMKVNPLLAEIDKKNKMINEFANDLGLTVLSSYKMAIIAKNGETLDGKKCDEDTTPNDKLFN